MATTSCAVNVLPVVQKSGDLFGKSIEVSGTTLVVGATDAAYIFELSATDWVEKAIITETAAGFGYSVSVSGTYIAVSAPSWTDATHVGCVYIYNHTGNGVYTQEAQVISPDSNNRASFGRSVSITLDTLIVGASDHVHPSDSTNVCGRAYVYTRNNTGVWSLLLQLEAVDAQHQAAFGFSVSISHFNDNPYVLVGSPNHSHDGKTACGAVYSYGRNYRFGNWEPLGQLLAPDAASSDAFGYSVSINENWGAIGAPQAGKVYRFYGGGEGYIGEWYYDSTVQPTIAGDFNFGASVDAWGFDVLVGAPLWDQASPALSDCGSVYHFKSGSPSTQYISVTAMSNAKFGTTVCFDDDGNVIVGEPANSTKHANAGAIYRINLNVSSAITITPQRISKSAYYRRTGFIENPLITGGTGNYETVLWEGVPRPTVLDSKRNLGRGKYKLDVTDDAGESASHTFIVKRHRQYFRSHNYPGLRSSPR